MRISVLNSPWYNFIDGRHMHGMRAGCRWPSLGPGGLPHFDQMRGNIYACYPFHMGYTASLLQSHGHDVQFIDACTDLMDFHTFYRMIEGFKPDIAILETSSASWYTDEKVAKTLHEDYGIRVALVGPHASAYTDIIQNDFVTWILTREYDDLALQVADGAAPGVLSGPLPDNLDERPFPYLEMPWAHYYQDYFGFGHFKRPSFQLWSTRGCKFSCNYCLWRWTMYSEDGKGSYRQRSAENVLAEIDDRFQRMGFQHVLIDDDTFSIVGKEAPGSKGYDRVVGICNGMEERGYEWSAMTRLDVHSLDLFQKMADAGCVGIKVGAESFSDKTLKGVTKHLKAAEMVDRIKAIIDMGICLYLATTTYIPGESEDDRRKSGQILEELAQYGGDRLKWQRPFMTPIPGTPLYNQFKEAGYFDEDDIDWQLFDGGAGRLHDIIVDFNKNHGVEGFDTGRGVMEESPHYAGQPGLKGRINEA